MSVTMLKDPHRHPYSSQGCFSENLPIALGLHRYRQSKQTERSGSSGAPVLRLELICGARDTRSRCWTGKSQARLSLQFLELRFCPVASCASSPGTTRVAFTGTRPYQEDHPSVTGRTRTSPGVCTPATLSTALAHERAPCSSQRQHAG